MKLKISKQEIVFLSPLDYIKILYYSSSDSVKMINNSTFKRNVDLVNIEENIKEVDEFINDHNYVCNQNNNNFF